jgi:cytochrome P450
MTLAGELELPSFDYTDPEMCGERFHLAMAELRAEGWLASGPFGYVVLDREAGEFFLRTRAASFPGMKIAEIFGVTEGPLWEQFKRNILHLGGADHSRLRSLVNPALSPRAVERYRPMMRGFLEDLLARATAASASAPAAATSAHASAPASASASAPSSASTAPALRCDFVEAFAKPYPSRTIANVMGAPIEDAPKLHHWSNWIQRQFDAVSMASEREQIERAVEEFYEYAKALVRARREDPGDDLISTLIAAEEAGDRLSDVECINLVFNVLAGGVDTTQSQLAHAIRLLAEHPKQWALLREDPSPPTLAAAAVEEALRYEPITPFTARIVDQEITFRDVTFPVETIVMVCAFTANRDAGEDGTGAHPPAAGGDEFDITASTGAHPSARALTFGAGVHYCLGANLARVELQEALAFLAERFERLELDGEPRYESITGIYGLGKLPVRLLP